MPTPNERQSVNDLLQNERLLRVFADAETEALDELLGKVLDEQLVLKIAYENSQAMETLIRNELYSRDDWIPF